MEGSSLSLAAILVCVRIIFQTAMGVNMAASLTLGPSALPKVQLVNGSGR